MPMMNFVLEKYDWDSDAWFPEKMFSDMTEAEGVIREIETSEIGYGAESSNVVHTEIDGFKIVYYDIPVKSNNVPEGYNDTIMYRVRIIESEV